MNALNGENCNYYAFIKIQAFNKHWIDSMDSVL